VPVVVLHGWEGSGPEHWQTWLVAQLRETGRDVRYPTLGNPDVPAVDEWLASMRAAIADLPPDGYDVVAHSLAAVLWLHHTLDPADSPRPARVVLVAPPSPATTAPEIAAMFPIRLDIDAVRRAADGTVLVGSDDDPWCPEGITAAYGLPLKIATTVLPGAQHINTDSGYGPWPAMLDWCNRNNLAFY
jgi:predicted alpha/beta hydrolase family esterase